MSMEIKIDDLSGPEIADFLEQHIDDMKAVSPPESKHALDLEALRASDITFWSVWDEGRLIGCGAIKELDNTHGEIKSMRTSASKRGAGVGSFMLSHILSVSKSRGYRKVSLETGSMDYFVAARKLYCNFGFTYCEPFGSYKPDPNSIFMSKKI